MCLCLFDDVTARHLLLILQEEQLQSSESEKNKELADAQQQLRQKVSRHCDSFYVTMNNILCS